MRIAFMLAVVYLTTLNTVTLGKPESCLSCNGDFNLGFGTPPCKCGCCPWPCSCDCIESHVCPTPVCNCLDLALIIDESGSIGAQIAWPIMKQFLVDIVLTIESANEGCINEVAVAPITFGTNTTLHWNILDSQNGDIDSIIAGLVGIEQDPGQTNIVEAMEVYINQVFPNSRPSCAKMAVIITDGKATFRLAELSSMAAQLDALTDELYCIAVTNKPDPLQLATLCGANVIDVNDFSELKDISLGFLTSNEQTTPPCEVSEACYCCCTPEQYWGLTPY